MITRRNVTFRTSAAIFFVFAAGAGSAFAGPATHFNVTECISFCPPPCAAPCGPGAFQGTPFPVVVTALDSSNQVDVSYVGTVSFSSSDRSATLPRPFAFGLTDAGYASIDGFVMRQLGTQTVTATDVSNPTVTGTVTFPVVPGPSVPTASPGMLAIMIAALAALGVWLSRSRVTGP